MGTLRAKPWHEEAERLLIHGRDRGDGEIEFPSYRVIAEHIGIAKLTLTRFATRIRAQERRVEFLLDHSAQQRRTIHLLESTLRDNLDDISDSDIAGLTKRVAWRALVRTFVDLSDLTRPMHPSVQTKLLAIAAKWKASDGAGDKAALAAIHEARTKINNAYDQPSSGILPTDSHTQH